MIQPTSLYANKRAEEEGIKGDQPHEWHPIPDYEGVYEICKVTGRVRSLDRETPAVIRGSTCNIHFTGKILTPKKGVRYPFFTLYKNGRSRNVSVHRIMAQLFIPNPLNYPQVNHIDGNKQNFNISNLEWCNNSMNQKHAYASGLKAAPWQGRTGEACPLSMPVSQYTLSGAHVKTYAACIDITRALGFRVGTLSSVRGKFITRSHGFIFLYIGYEFLLKPFISKKYRIADWENW